MRRLFTNESGTESISSKISDDILDDILTNDQEARVACEITVTTGSNCNR